MISSPLASARLVGREDELQFLRARLDFATHDGPRAVLVEGEAGIGKTRLIREIREYAQRAGIVCLAAAALEHARDPYLPFSIAFERYDGDELASAADALRAESTLPKGRRFLSVRAAIAALVARRPALLIVEDVHWADAASVELLAFLVEEFAEAPLAIVATARPVEHGETQRVIARATRSMHRVRLRPLSDPEMTEFLRESIRTRATLSPERLRRIVHLAEGNPLFAQELLRWALEGNPGDSAPSAMLPALARFERLPESARRVIECACVLHRVDVAALSGILELDRAAVERALAEAAAGELVRESGERWGFLHALTREAIYQHLDASTRALLHANIGTYLETSTSTRDYAELAYHWSMTGDRARNMHYNEEAGNRAYALHAYYDAARFFERVIALEPQGIATIARLNQKLGQAYLKDGRAELASLPLRAAFEAFESQRDAEGMASTELSLSFLAWRDGNTQRCVEIAENALERIAQLPAGDLHFQLAVRVAMAEQLRGRLDRVAIALERADALLAHAGPDNRMPYFNTKAMYAAARWHVDDALDAYGRAIDDCERTDNTELLVSTLNNRGLNAALFGRAELAAASFERALAVAYDNALRWHVPNTALSFAFASWLFGELERARTLMWDALAAPHDVPSRRAWLGGYGIPIGLALGDASLVERCTFEATVDEALGAGDADRIAPLVFAFTEVHAARGETAKAAGLAARAIEATSPHDLPRFFAYAVAKHGNAEARKRIGARLESGVAADRGLIAERDLALATIALESGDKRTASRLAMQAAAEYSALQWPWWQARALEAAGRKHQAIDIYRRIGAAGDLARLQAGTAPAADALASLTPRERQVADLAIEGRSSRDIAAALGLSERTVGNHLQSAFNRLGINSRRELMELATKVPPR